jgi:hypothetical protein
MPQHHPQQHIYANANANNPYGSREHNASDLSLDEQNEPRTPHSGTPIYTQRSDHNRGNSITTRRRPVEDDTGSLEMQVGYAR